MHVITSNRPEGEARARTGVAVEAGHSKGVKQPMWGIHPPSRRASGQDFESVNRSNRTGTGAVSQQSMMSDDANHEKIGKTTESTRTSSEAMTPGGCCCGEQDESCCGAGSSAGCCGDG